MKKLLGLTIVLFLAFFFVSCDDENYKIKEVDSGISCIYIKSTLEDDGYDFDYMDHDYVQDYNTNSVNSVYSINVTVTDMFVGYLNNQNWVAIIIFDDSTEAQTYYDAVDTQNTTGLLLYKYGVANTVVVTYTQSVIDTLDALTPPI